MSKLLILFCHPHVARSKANAALLGATRGLEGVEVAHLDGLYPEGAIDLDAEVARLIAAERVVLQFPIQWYSTPPLLKAWQDSVLTRMFYMAYEAEGRLIAGRPLMVAATAGNLPEAYSAEGVNLFPLAELLKPLHSTANRCGLAWQEPFLLFRANRLEASALQDAAAAYRTRLQALLAA
ncbi:NAD(P)H-dependent oxidoreductase [Roseomonas sp. 18066]|uniref:NAD(P)H-dependent oxidoreductase n=1 Tax=Roseomonas sp. 18066 TaxID=2681412 RepID=UPI0013594EEC|nr:NAD(P)H-dependent oxidoreductase [Roseomonas sp. 18066]